jgi:pteridine reductase
VKLQGRAALVTGAGKRVGRAIAIALARRGMSVALHHNRSRAEAVALARELRLAHGVKAVAVRAELSDARACARVVAEAAAALGGLDALINNASIWEPTAFGRVTASDWDRHLDVNARAPFFLAQAAAARLRRARGHVINIADWAARRPYAGYTPYCVSKAALLCLNAALAKELAPDVQVNAILPGPVLQPRGQSRAQAEAVRRATVLKRLGGPEDVVKAVLFLLDCDFMTGAEITVDGGRMIA